MAAFLLRYGLNSLRILIVVGALASVIQPQVSYRIQELTLASDEGTHTGVLALEGRSMMRLALTAIGLSLL